MTDVLIRNVPEDQLARIDQLAAELGLSRGAYLRRQIAREAGRVTGPVTMEDLTRAADLSQDLLDDQVMDDAWS